MGMKKKQTAITAADVPRVLNDACIEKLAIAGQLPDTADLRCFRESIREAARIYAWDARSLTVGTVRDEIASLYKAAEHKRYDRVPLLVANLSLEACAYLEVRLKLPGPRQAKLRLPTVGALRDPSRRDEGCEMIEWVCRIGGNYVDGRKRSSGRRSMTWQPLLFAPVPNEHPPKRTAELRFVMHLRLTWLESVGKPPTATVNPSRPDRPFPTLVRKCLELVGAPRADAVGLIK